MTESEVLALLRARHIRDGNGGSGEFAFLTHVRNAAAFGATRTFDALAMSLWPSRGLHLHAFEVKCSRSDWLRELKEPAKADVACRLVDRFSLVVSDAKIVAEGELPPTWGLLVVRGSRLECVRDAPLLPGADPTRPISRSFLVALLRAGGATPSATAQEVNDARLDGYKRGEELGENRAERAEEHARKLAAVIDDFERASGIALTGFRARADVADIGATVKAVLDNDARRINATDAIARARRELLQAARALDRYLPEARRDADDDRIARRVTT